MSLQNLFQNLDDIIRTPEDVARLNATILEIAVGGRLVPQGVANSAEEVSVEGWTACQLGDLLSGIEAGKSFAASNRPAEAHEYGVLKVSAVTWGEFRPQENKALPLDAKIQLQHQIRAGDVLVSRANTAELVGAVVMVDRDYPALLLSDKTLRLVFSSSDVCLPYIVLALRSKVARDYFAANATGTSASMRNLSQDKIRGVPLNLPPLAEQHRIVAKVDELLAQTRALEANLRRAQQEIVVVNQAALHRLETAEDPASLRAAWHTISGAFDLLYDDPRPLAALRQTILQLAVSGKLVRQDHNDEPGMDSLRRIHTERIEQLGALSLEHDAQAPVTGFPYGLPNSWTLARLGHLADIQGGVTKGRNLNLFETVLLPYLRVANVQRGYLVLDEVKDIEVKIEEQDKYALQVGDLLLTEGGDADKLGRTAIWRGEIPNCIHQNHIFRARLLSTDLLPEWFMLYLNSGYGQSYFLGSAKQTTNLATINMRQLRSCPIPIPPTEEQRRIVAKVDELLGMCDTLERQLDRSTAAQKAAVASVLAHLP